MRRYPTYPSWHRDTNAIINKLVLDTIEMTGNPCSQYFQATELIQANLQESDIRLKEKVSLGIGKLRPASSYPIVYSDLLEDWSSLFIGGVLKQIMASRVCVPDYDAVISHLKTEDTLELVFQICSKAQQFFHDNYFLSLEIVSDPEIEDRVLTLFIRQSSYDDDIMDKIDVFRASFEAEMTQLKGWVNITTDFKDTRAIECGF